MSHYDEQRERFERGAVKAVKEVLDTDYLLDQIDRLTRENSTLTSRVATLRVEVESARADVEEIKSAYRELVETLGGFHGE